MGNMYDLDVAIEILARMHAKKREEFKCEIDPAKKKLLEQEIDMLRAEEKALYINNLIQQSVIDKAFRLYGPILKAEILEYAAV
jgi:hypothetical protein